VACPPWTDRIGWELSPTRTGTRYGRSYPWWCTFDKLTADSRDRSRWFFLRGTGPPGTFFTCSLGLVPHIRYLSGTGSTGKN
jgi:hypothetical protein